MTQQAMDIEEVIKTDHLFHPMRQLQRRTNLGLETAPIKSFISKTRFVSLGSYCGVAQALQSLGFRGEAGPFDWMRTRCEAVTRLVETQFEEFFDMETPFTRHCGTRIFPMKWGGSHWHHDFDDDEVQETMQRRKERFLSAAAENLVFIRAVNDTEELLAIPRLFQALKRRFAGSHVRLLVLVDHQDVASNVVAQDLGKDIIFSTANGRVWEGFLNIPEYDPRHMRIRMEWASDEYCKSIAQAMKMWTSAGSYSLWPSLASYKRWLCPFVSPDPKWEAFRGRRVARVPAAYTTFQAATSAAQLCFRQAAVVVPQNHWIAGGRIVRRT